MSIVHLGNRHGVFGREHKGHDTLPADIGKRLVSIFQGLSNPNLSNRCPRSTAQNANEALHSIL